MKKHQPVLIFEIKLKHANIPVWRIVEVKRTSTLHEFACVIMVAMGWEGNHMYQFKIGNREFEYYDSNDDFDPEYQNEEAEPASFIKLSELQLKISDTFEFTYDFGDNWEHTITLAGMGDKRLGLWDYPTCSAGSMNCPPEDCGGIEVYNEIVAFCLERKPMTINPDLQEWFHDFDVYATENIRDLGFVKNVRRMMKQF